MLEILVTRWVSAMSGRWFQNAGVSRDAGDLAGLMKVMPLLSVLPKVRIPPCTAVSYLFTYYLTGTRVTNFPIMAALGLALTSDFGAKYSAE